jgi:hypothetical protein
MGAFVPEEDAREHAESRQPTAPQIHEPHRGEDARAHHAGKEYPTKGQGHEGMVGHHRQDHVKEAQIVHKDFVALIPPIPPGNPPGQMPPPEPPADGPHHYAQANSMHVLPEMVTPKPYRERAQHAKPEDIP